MKAGVIFLPTSPGGLESVKQVDPLDVVGERGVGHQGLVAVDVVHCKFERQLVHAHQLTLAGLKNTTCQHAENVDKGACFQMQFMCRALLEIQRLKCDNCIKKKTTDLNPVVSNH